MYLGILLSSAQICKKYTVLGNSRVITQEGKKEIKQKSRFFSSTF